MLILILIDAQYSQTTVFSFEKGLNCQNNSSVSHHPLKKSPPVVFTTFWHKVRETLEVLGEKELQLYVET